MPKVQITDQQLRDEMAAGLKPAQIATKYGLTRQSVSERVRKLSLTTATVAAVAPVESRQYVRHQLDAMTELLHSLERIKLLYDACDAWLRDADDPTRYDVGARSDEVMVTYWEADGEEMKPAKATLAHLLRRLEEGGIVTIKAETKHVDIRTLTLSTAQECRQIITTCKELALMLADARAMETLREALLSEIAKVSPDVAQSIAEAVRRILILHDATGGPGAVSARESG